MVAVLPVWTMAVDPRDLVPARWRDQVLDDLYLRLRRFPDGTVAVLLKGVPTSPLYERYRQPPGTDLVLLVQDVAQWLEDLGVSGVRWRDDGDLVTAAAGGFTNRGEAGR